MVEIIYRHPNARVMALGARILNWTDPAGKQEFYEPEDREVTVNGKKVECIIYTLPIQYARSLLGEQPERYFLLSPKKLVVQVLTQDRVTIQSKVVKSVLEVAESFPTPKIHKEKITPPKKKEGAFKAERPPNAPPVDNTPPAETETETEDNVNESIPDINPLHRPPTGEG